MTLEEDLISIIVPIYNVEKYLDKCIQSIINQTYKNIEIILVDDGSTDNSGKICDKYIVFDNRVKVIHQKNCGVSASRNTGFEISKGKWIAFIDSDDWVEKKYIKTLYDEAIENKADIVISSYNRVSGTKKIVDISEEKIFYNKEEYLLEVLNPQTAMGFCHMKLINRNIAKEIKFDEKLKVGEDALYNIELSKNLNKAIKIKKNLYNYRINENSIVKKFDSRYVEKYYNAMENIKKYISDTYPGNEIIIQNFYNFVAYHAMIVCVNYCCNKKNPNPRKVLQIKKVCNLQVFKEGIKKSNYEKISATRKITLFTLKKHLYILTYLICIIRKKQNRGK